MDKIIKFINDNLRWVTIILLILFLFKSVQSCTRLNKIEKREKKIELLNDSIKEIKSQYIDSIEVLQNELGKLNYALDLTSKSADEIKKIASNMSLKNTNITIKNNTNSNEK